MKRLLLLGVVASLTAVFLLPVAASAKASKVDVCHSSQSGWKVINPSERALAAHIRHGDGLPGEAVPDMDGYTFDADCVPVADDVPELVFVVAYTDMVDDGGAYDPAVDVMIAKLIDGPGGAADGLVGVGDLVVTNRYPLTLAGPYTFGSFGATEHATTSVIYAGDSTIAVAVGDARFVWNQDVVGQIESYGESFAGSGSGSSGFLDELAETSSDDVIDVIPPGPSSADVPANEDLSRGSDDAFLDVEITLP